MTSGPLLGPDAAVHWVDGPGGVRVRAVHWPGGGRGTVVLLNGWTEFVERYRETVGELRGRGFAVWSLDWRGQGLSSRLLPDRLRSHVSGFEDYLDDLDRVLDRLVLPGMAGPLLLMGHSMGGHLAARMLLRRPGLFGRAILSAPMIDILRGPGMVRELARGLAEAVCRLPGGAVRFAPGVPRAPRVGRPFEGNRLTSCPERYAEGDALVLDRPELQLGGITWGWLRAAFASIAALRRAGVVESIGVPVLVLIAEHERVVDNAATRAFARRLPLGQLVEIAGARHELLRERDAIRAEVWAEVDRFLPAA